MNIVVETPPQTTKPKKPTIVLVGFTNVGKSTLFNRLLGRQIAVTALEENTTRDRIIGDAEWQNKQFTLVDTGGLLDDKNSFSDLILKQTDKAIADADIILFVFNGREKITPNENRLISQLRKTKNIWLVANKIDSIQILEKTTDYKFLGLPFYQISALSGKGVGDLVEDLTKNITHEELNDNQDLPLISIVGRPNVGKSTLMNALIKDERSVVSDIPGTTRDPVLGKLQLKNNQFQIADTAGVRRRGKIEVGIEKFSVERTEKTIEQSKVVIVVIDAIEGFTRGDLHLIFKARDLKKPVLIAVNKMDLKPDFSPNRHVKNVEVVAISAKEQIGLENIKTWLSKNL